MSFTEYITSDGDRWDTIAYRAYGDVQNWTTIIRANPSLPIQDVYPAGIRLVIPIIAAPTSTPSEANKLPPWKR